MVVVFMVIYPMGSGSNPSKNQQLNKRPTESHGTAESKCPTPGSWIWWLEAGFGGFRGKNPSNI